jgi:hypothetical protein
MNGNDPKKTYDLGMLPEIEISTSKDGKIKGVKTPNFSPNKELRPVDNNSTSLKNKFAGAIGSFAGEHAAGMAKSAMMKQAAKMVAEAGLKAGERNIKKNAPAIMKSWNKYKTTSIAGQSIGNDGKVLYDMEDGPRKGDIVRGKHLKFDGSGYVEDNDYNIKLHRERKSGNIYKTTGIK